MGTNPIYSNGTKHGGVVRAQSPTQGSAEAAIEQNIKRDHPGPFTNNEFLVSLGLELCVNRIKRDENKDAGADAFESAECGRDFSPAWKFDPDGRRLCQKCYSQSQMKDLTKVASRL